MVDWWLDYYTSRSVFGCQNVCLSNDEDERKVDLIQHKNTNQFNIHAIWRRQCPQKKGVRATMARKQARVRVLLWATPSFALPVIFEHTTVRRIAASSLSASIHFIMTTSALDGRTYSRHLFLDDGYPLHKRIFHRRISVRSMHHFSCALLFYQLSLSRENIKEKDKRS